MTELDFKADEWRKVPGRGWVAIFSGDPLPPLMRPNNLLHRYVKIDGKEYWVTGVETQGYNRDRFALIIRGEK